MTRKNATEIKAAPGKQEVFIVREFDASRDLVFEAFTKPELLAQWFLPKELRMKIDVMDCRTGGSYRHTHTHAGGMQFGFNGVYHEVTAPERIIKTSEFEGLPERGHVVLEITTFEVLPDERTQVTIHSICRSVAQRDGMVNAGMEPALTVAHHQLDELLAKGF
ncbi:MAG TPA: SRPBCC family protein [Blastocatellia bacterium]|nr:SRPBCC family protein [Blastocatellia bacterium]HMX27207.1 SRPBCC family protein [Blastocatellia bacterium]HMZ19947.1 SRPBCC family protein [Blastocatellia bacterium]HNG29846.1 SRPBCC family protein [Blastocatellia bacterium]